MTPSSFPSRRSALRRLAPAALMLAALWPGLMGLPLAQQSDQPAIRARLGADGRLEVVSLSPAAQTAPAGTVAPIEAISSAVRPIDREAAQSLNELLGDPTPAKTPEPRPEPAPAAAPEPAQPQLPEPAPAVKPAASAAVKPATHTTPTQVTPPTAVASAASAIESPVLAASQPEPPAAASAASADSAASAASASLIESVRQSLGNISPGTAAAVAVGVGIVVAGAAAVLGVAGTAAAATTAAATAAAAGTGVSWLTWVTSFIQKFVAKIIANPLEWLVQQLVKRKLIKFFKLEHILTPGGLWRTIKTRWQHWRERRG